MTPELSRGLNALGLLAVCFILAAAFFDQIVNHDLPCPLCLLQRVGFVAVGVGLCLNVLHGPRPHHYGMMILAALFGMSVAVRQVLLHIVPGTGSYGDAVLGLHLYTWSAVFFFLILVGSGLMLLFDGQYAGRAEMGARFGGQVLAGIAFWLMVLLAGANAVSAFLECGPGVCAEDPVRYRMLERGAETGG